MELLKGKLMGKIGKQNEDEVCPKCGATAWLGTSFGPMCKQCGFLNSKQDAPVNKEKKTEK
jgi:ribosomal protein L37E